MQTYVLRTGREISPFGPLEAIRIHNRPWPALRDELLRQCGCRVEHIDRLDQATQFPCLLLHDDLYFTPSAVRRFLKAARGQTGNRRAALAVSLLTEAVAPALQGELAESDDGPLRLYSMYYLREACEIERTMPLTIAAPFGKIAAPAHPKFAENGRHVTPFSHVYLSPLQHWANLVACNLLGMSSVFLRTARARWGATMMLPLLAAWRSGSVRPQQMAGKAYWAGPRARIHPTAVVEGAVIGRRVKIEPHAVVRFCVIDDHCVIGSNARLDGCTLGRRTLVSPGVVARGSVFGAECSLSTPFNQLSVAGERVVLCPNSGALDFSFRGTVPVSHQGETIRSGAKILGVAFGDDVFLGPNIEVAGGQELPAGCTLVRNPRELIRDPELADLPPDVWRLDRGKRNRRAA
ncbi:MAG: hypothetical protein KDB14_20870 [Planctomycetales bacterium]|nr:hypothetical protein [Planctomycetales bacterium]